MGSQSVSRRRTGEAVGVATGSPVDLPEKAVLGRAGPRPMGLVKGTHSTGVGVQRDPNSRMGGSLLGGGEGPLLWAAPTKRPSLGTQHLPAHT